MALCNIFCIKTQW